MLPNHKLFLRPLIQTWTRVFYPTYQSLLPFNPSVRLSHNDIMTTEWTIAQHRERILQDFRTCTTTNLLPRTRTPRSRDSSRKRKAAGRRIPWKRRVLVLSLRRRILQVRYRTAISTMIARSTVIYEHFPRAKFSPLPTFPDYRLSAAQGRE